MTMTDLIVDFPHQRNQHLDLIVDFPRQRNHLAVSFADMVQVRIVERHGETDNVARHELWYTESEYYWMRRAAAKTALMRVRKLGKLHQDASATILSNNDNNTIMAKAA